MKEVRDQLRDRRTLFMVLVLPMLLYPVMGVAMVQMTVQFSEQPRTVVLLGTDNLPDHPPLNLSTDRLRVISDTLPDPKDKPVNEPLTEDEEYLLQQAGTIRKQLQELTALESERNRRNPKEDEQDEQETSTDDSYGAVDAVSAMTDGELGEKLKNLTQQQLEMRISVVRKHLAQLFAESSMQVLIVIPDGYANKIAEINKKIADQHVTLEELSQVPQPLIVQNAADEKSQIAYLRVRDIIDDWKQQIFQEQLESVNLPGSLQNIITPTLVDLSTHEDQIASNLWSKMFPALLVIMTVTGAFYPAIDLAAGEKERGTMETLLICPASRTEIVLGKFFTVMLFSITTAVLNLFSMGLTGQYMLSIVNTSVPNGAAAAASSFALPSMHALIWMGILLLPLAALFSALCLSLATFARSSKEGQYYLTPLLTVTLGLTVFCLMPNNEISYFYSYMPVVGVSLLLKALLLNPDNLSLYSYAIPVLVTSIGYSLLALWWAIDQFASEEVLFREAERFELNLWVKHLLRDKEATPSFSEAAFCFILMIIIQFFSMKYFGDLINNAPPGSKGLVTMQLLMVQQLIIFATPALLMTLMLTTSIRQTLRLNMPNPKLLIAAAILPLALHPLSVELMGTLEGFFPPLPERIAQVFASMSADDQPWWLIVLAFAAAPAICEELAFRGFILSGFAHTKRYWLAIVLSSLCFGIVHGIPQQVFNAALLGLVLGLIAIRSNSLFPCMLFHVIYNSLQVLRLRVDQSLLTHPPANWFFRIDEGVIRYDWPTLIISAVVAIALLRMFAYDKTTVIVTADNDDTFADSASTAEQKTTVSIS